MIGRLRKTNSRRCARRNATGERFCRNIGNLFLIWAVHAYMIAHVCAEDLRGVPVPFRINLALDRVSSYTDVVGRGASAAHPLGSSVNPASYDFLRDPPFNFKAVGSLSSNVGVFNRGTWATGLSANAAYRLAEVGTISALFVRTDSHNAVSEQGDEFSLRSNQFSLGYSQRISKRFSLGANIRVSEGNLGIDDSFLGFPRGTKTDSIAGDFTLGGLLFVNERWSLGLLGGAGWAPSHTKVAVDLPQPPFGPGPFTLKLKDTTHSRHVRTGIGWRPVDYLGVYMDSQYLHIDNKSGAIDVARGFLGAEMFPLQGLALRLGTSVDTEAQATFSTGIGVYFIKNVPLEIAYSYNAFPEVRREFGRAHLISISVAVVY
jgi:hypothetical protein